MDGRPFDQRRLRWINVLANGAGDYSQLEHVGFDCVEVSKKMNKIQQFCFDSNEIIRDVSREGEHLKRLKRVRKVYRLPSIYDISTLTSISYDWAIIIEAERRRDVRTNRYAKLQRSETFD